MYFVIVFMITEIIKQILTLISENLLVSIFVSLILGFLIGYLIKKVIQIGLILLAILIILIGIGIISPSSIIHEIDSLGIYANQIKSLAENEINLIPYNSIFFIIGLVIGLIKG